jgi:hypothetical protein
MPDGCKIRIKEIEVGLMPVSHHYGSRNLERRAATVLAGELSLIGAITADEYDQAHALYGRKTRGSDGKPS